MKKNKYIKNFQKFIAGTIKCANAICLTPICYFVIMRLIIYSNILGNVCLYFVLHKTWFTTYFFFFPELSFLCKKCMKRIRINCLCKKSTKVSILLTVQEIIRTIICSSIVWPKHKYEVNWSFCKYINLPFRLPGFNLKVLHWVGSPVENTQASHSPIVAFVVIKPTWTSFFCHSLPATAIIANSPPRNTQASIAIRNTKTLVIL